MPFGTLRIAKPLASINMTKTITFFIVGVLSINSSMRACSCIGQQLDILYYNNSHSIFTGELVETEIKENSNWQKLKFKVSKSYKGNYEEFITIYTHRQVSACGLSGLNIGDNWLIYAFGNNKTQTTNRCSLSKKDSDKDFTKDTTLLNTIFNKRNSYFKSEKAEGNFIEGEPNGEWKYYFKHSFSKGIYKNSVKNGLWTQTSIDGRIEFETLYKNGRKKWEKNYNKDGQIIFERHYNSWDEKLTIKNYDDGTPRQIFKKHYFPFSYTKFTEYYPNGQLKEKGNFRWGKWRYYSEDGKLIKKEKPVY